MRYPYEHRSKYAHMMPNDVKLWDTFIDKFPNYFDSVEYDVKVGKGIEPEEHWDAQTTLIATNLTLCRIDALGFNGNQPTIVEVKPRARTTAIGQVQTYSLLFLSTFPGLPQPKKLIVTDYTTQDISEVAKKLNIKIIELDKSPHPI